jgi:hypothetical protein
MRIMDEAERRRFLDTLRTDEDFRAAVRRELLIDELLSLPAVVATLAADLHQLTVKVDALVDAVAHQRRDFNDLAAISHSYMQRTITLLQEGFDLTRAAISALRDAISALRDDMTAGFTAVDARFDQVNADIRELRQDVRDLRDRFAS